MKNKILSIIIPSYNMEKYLEQCVNSLIIPDIDKLDILIINDGSKDRTSEIGHRYETKYPDSIRCIDKKNGNYGSCINCGLSIATGKYIKILDADDSFNKDNLNTYVGILECLDADCIITNYQKVNSKEEVIKKITYNEIPQNRKSSLSEVEKILLQKLAMHAVTYRTDLLKEIQYKQTEGISYTDIEWIYTPIAASASFIYIPLVIYNYLIGREGQTIDPKVSSKHLNDSIIGIKTQTRLLENYRKDDLIPKEFLKKSLAKRLVRLYSSILVGAKGNRRLLAEFDKEYNSRLEQLGIYLTKRSLSPIGNKSYVQMWRDDNYNEKFTLPSLYRLGLHILKIWTKVFSRKTFKIEL